MVRELFLNVTVAIRTLARTQFQLVQRGFVGFIQTHWGKVVNVASG